MTRARSPVAFGHFVITRRIARGGMAEIFRARTRARAPEVSRWVALKLMRPSLGHEELRQRLFQREVRIASRIHHPNVVPVFEHGRDLDREYLAMEYVLGRDLSHLVKNDRRGVEGVSVEVGLHIGFLAAAGLGHAHRLREDDGSPLGIVHRDVSPGNVMIGFDGTVKVLDFGVARINEKNGTQTQTGTLRGKFAYMSPEQTRGESLDARSDVFSLGIVLYELLTGMNCFRASNPIATLERVQNVRPAPPSRENPAIPKAVDRILARCLAKDRRRRFQDGKELSEAIGEYLDHERIDGSAMLLEHVDRVFAWEQHEDRAELEREAEEVDLLDVVDFMQFGNDGSLDSPRIATPEDQEASRAEIKRISGTRRRETQDSQPVFESDFGGALKPNVEDPERRGEAQVPGEEGTVVARFGPSVAVGSGASSLDRVDQSLEHFDQDVAPGRSVDASSLLGAPPIGPDVRGLPSDAPPASSPTMRVMHDLSSDHGDSTEREGAELGLGLGLGFGEEERDTLRTVAFASAPARRQWAAEWMRSKRRVLLLVAAALVLVSVLAAWLVATRVQGPEPSRGRGSVPQANRLPPIEIAAETSLESVSERPPAKRGAPTHSGEANGDGRINGGRGGRETDDRKIRARAAAEETSLASDESLGVGRESMRDVRRSARRSVGYLNVRARPWAEITINGKPWPGATPQVGIELSSGRHVVTLHNPDTEATRTVTVFLRPGRTKSLEVDMSSNGD